MSKKLQMSCERCAVVFSFYRNGVAVRRFCSHDCSTANSHGRKQSPEWVAQRKKFGADHHAWKGDSISRRSGRSRALRWFTDIGPCVDCGASDKRVERHHRDENPINNDPSNIEALCRSCHLARHGAARRAS